MKTTVFVAFAFGAWASVALAEPPPPEDLAVAGPVALTEAEMDRVAAGGMQSFDVKFEGRNAGGHPSVSGSRATGTGVVFFRISDQNSPLPPD